MPTTRTMCPYCSYADFCRSGEHVTVAPESASPFARLATAGVQVQRAG